MDNNATKVYLVTSGSYSDYSIDKIFLDYEKAKQYHDLCTHYDLNDIEERELSDDETFTPFYYIKFKYYIPGMEKEYKQTYHQINKPHLMGGQYYIDVEQCLDSDIYHIERDTSYENGIIHLLRPIGLNKDNIDTEVLAAKYLKVCHDLEAQVRYLFYTGYSEFDVRRMFSRMTEKFDEEGREFFEGVGGKSNGDD